MKITTSRGTYEIHDDVAGDILGSAVDGLASRLTEYMEPPGWEDWVTEDEVADARILQKISTGYAEIYDPIFRAYDAQRDDEG